MAGTSYIYRVVSCCDTRIFGEFQSPVNIPTGTYTYSGPTYIDPNNGFEWVNGQCYQIIKVGTGGTPTGAILPDTDLTRIIGDCLTEPCPCALNNRYLIFQKCCDNSLIYFKSTEDGSYLVGLKEYTGTPTYLLENICYRVDTVAVGIGPIVNDAMWNALPLAPNAPNYTGPTNVTIDCTDEGYQAECPVCVEKCFMLTTCDGNIIYTNTNLSLYVGQFITINDQDNNPIVGTWYVIEKGLPCPPNSFFSSLQVTGSNLQPDCPNECYEVTGTPTIVIYVDQDQVTQELLGPGKFCSIVQPIIMGGIGEVFNYGNCVNNECAELCYLFTNCVTSETLTVVSNTPNISQYASQNKVVTLNGYEGCWTIELSQDCNCPVNVTILQVFDDCPSCLPTIAYKFTNCNNQAIIRYSTDDYSAYVGKTVQLECGECWFVDQIDYVPPATQSIVILYTFDSCLACNRTYYKLADCLDPNVNITYTYSDLSAYVNQIVKIKGCDSCFTVTETREPINASIVEVTDSYIDCPECLGTFPCVCTKVSNTTNTEQTYCYIDCDFNQHSVTLLPGESSDKICVIKWIGCPQETCECLEGSLTYTVEGNTSIVSYKFEKTTEIKNGKIVYNGYLYFSDNVNAYIKYKLSYEIDNCWYMTTDVGTESFPFNPAPLFKLCTDSNCPVGNWEYVECGCVRGNLSSEIGEISFSVGATGIDANGYFVYQNPEFIISYNAALGRWELYERNPLKLIAYSITTTSNCPIITNVKEAWIFVQPSMYILFNTDPCSKIDITYEYNTIECQLQCDCFTINITYDDYYGVPGLTFTGIPILSGNTINGKPKYIFNTGVDSIFYIHWDLETNCWILSDTDVINGNPISNTYATLCDSLNDNCPIGTWGLPPTPGPAKAAAAATQNITNVVTNYCTDSTGVIGSPTPPDYIEQFGDCINGKCPVIPFPKRKVKPGYSAPICDPDKYEKITCKASEIYYKQVMRLRYGISNCCPEDEEKWLVKKELIDLQALVDPDYICKPLTSCCNQPITSCGCGCNDTLKTCNS